MSFNTTTTTQQPDLSAFKDSVQFSLDRMQSQLDLKIDLLTHSWEYNFQISLNNIFGMMSARIVDFQFQIEHKLDDQFSNFRADILTTLRR